MKAQARILYHLSIAMVVALALVACQQRRVTPLQARYQQESNKNLSKITARLSQAYRGASSGRNMGSDFGSGSGDGSGDVSLIPQGGQGGQSYGWPGGTSQLGLPSWGADFYQPPQKYIYDYRQSASRCVSLIQAIPKRRDTYGVAMATLSRCLNRLIQERNSMLTWMYQQGDTSSQQQWAYAMNFARWGSYPQMPRNDFSYIYPFAQNGFGSGY